jgi:hypothetical protein
MNFPLGQPVTLTFLTYADPAQTTLADTTTVSIDVLDPAGNVTTYTLTSGVTHAGTGTYAYTASPAVAGHYEYHWYSTGPVTTALDGSFDVDPEYASALVSVDDFAVYLEDAGLDRTRARYILSLAQRLCETIVKPLPEGADLVILDVAQRAFANPANPRGGNGGFYAEGQGPYSDVSPGTAAGGLYLTRANETKLRQLAGTGGGAFTIDTMPAGAGTGLPWWDTASTGWFGP